MHEVLDSALGNPSVRMEVELKPAQGTRFQPTGFPDLGPATFTRPDGTEMLLVESAQSMANRLEAVFWDEERGDLMEVLDGIPYVKIDLGDGRFTSSILEAHRLNSPYILESNDRSFHEVLIEEFKPFENSPVDLRKVARVVFRYDPNCLIHGVFFAKKDLAVGRIKMARLLSAFIEAEGVNIAESGGVKFDIVKPTSTESSRKVGFGTIPFPRVEFTADRITAFFSFDASQLRGYALERNASRLITALAFWKIREFLEAGMRLRTACDLEPQELKVTSPSNGFDVPSIAELEAELPALVSACREEGLFAEPPVTVVEWRP
jgi:CRISPR-associated protein Csb1